MAVVIGAVYEVKSGGVGRHTGISVRKMKHSVVRQTSKYSGFDSNKVTHVLSAANTTVVSNARQTKAEKFSMVDDWKKLHQPRKPVVLSTVCTGRKVLKLRYTDSRTAVYSLHRNLTRQPYCCTTTNVLERIRGPPPLRQYVHGWRNGLLVRRARIVVITLMVHANIFSTLLSSCTCTSIVIHYLAFAVEQYRCTVHL